MVSLEHIYGQNLQIFFFLHFYMICRKWLDWKISSRKIL